MKQEKIKQMTKTRYECEVCGFISFSKQSVLNCEKRHACDHRSVYEFQSASDEGWWFNTKGINKECSKCGKLLGSVEFEDIEDDQKLIMSMFEMVEANR